MQRNDTSWVPLSSMTAHLWAIEQMAADRSGRSRRLPRLRSLVLGLFGR